MTNPASTSPETLYTAAAWLHAQANEVIGRRSEAELRPAQVIELRRFERAAQDVYEKAREAARHSPGAPWLVNVATGKDYGRDAAFNHGTLTAAAGARATQALHLARTMNARVGAAAAATTDYMSAVQSFNAVRHDQDGRPNDRAEAHIEYASAAVGLAGARTIAPFDIGAVGLRLDNGRLQVSSVQLRQLDDAAAALRTAQQRDNLARSSGRTLAPHDAAALEKLPNVLAAEQAQRLATMQALTQGAIAALSPATSPMTSGNIAAVAGADAATMGHVTAFAVAIRQAVTTTGGPEGDALRRLYANPTAWTNAWTSYLQAQVTATERLSIRGNPMLTQNLAAARQYLAGR